MKFKYRQSKSRRIACIILCVVLLSDFLKVVADASLVHFAGGQGGRLLSTGLFSAAQVLVCLEEVGVGK